MCINEEEKKKKEKAGALPDAGGDIEKNSAMAAGEESQCLEGVVSVHRTNTIPLALNT